MIKQQVKLDDNFNVIDYREYHGDDLIKHESTDPINQLSDLKEFEDGLLISHVVTDANGHELYVENKNGWYLRYYTKDGHYLATINSKNN